MSRHTPSVRLVGRIVRPPSFDRDRLVNWVFWIGVSGAFVIAAFIGGHGVEVGMSTGIMSLGLAFLGIEYARYVRSYRPVIRLRSPGFVGDSLIVQFDKLEGGKTLSLSCTSRERPWDHAVQLWRTTLQPEVLRKPIQIDIPDGLPPTTEHRAYPRVRWILEIEGDPEIGTYRFEVPVLHQVIREPVPR